MIDDHLEEILRSRRVPFSQALCRMGSGPMSESTASFMLDAMSLVWIEETVARYFPYLAHEMQAAGFREDADQLMKNGSAKIALPEAALHRIVERGVEAGVPLASVVAYRLRVLDHARKDDAFASDPEVLFSLDELYDLFSAIQRSETLSSYLDEAGTRFDALFSDLQVALGTRPLLSLLGATK